MDEGNEVRVHTVEVGDVAGGGGGAMAGEVDVDAFVRNGMGGEDGLEVDGFAGTVECPAVDEDNGGPGAVDEGMESGRWHVGYLAIAGRLLV